MYFNNIKSTFKSVPFSCSHIRAEDRQIFTSNATYKNITLHIAVKGEYVTVSVYRPGIGFFLNYVGMGVYFKGKIDINKRFLHGQLKYNLFSKLFVFLYVSFLLILNLVAITFAVGALFNIEKFLSTFLLALIFPPLSFVFLRFIDAMIQTFEDEKSILIEYLRSMRSGGGDEGDGNEGTGTEGRGKGRGDRRAEGTVVSCVSC